MKIQKLVTYLALLLGVLGMFFQGMIIFKGNDAIKSAAMGGDYGTVSLMVGLAFIILIVVVAVTVIFSLITLGSKPCKIEKSYHIYSFIWVNYSNRLFIFKWGYHSPERRRNAFS